MPELPIFYQRRAFFSENQENNIKCGIHNRQFFWGSQSFTKKIEQKLRVKGIKRERGRGKLENRTVPLFAENRKIK